MLVPRARVVSRPRYSRAATKVEADSSRSAALVKTAPRVCAFRGTAVLYRAVPAGSGTRVLFCTAQGLESDGWRRSALASDPGQASSIHRRSARVVPISG